MAVLIPVAKQLEMAFLQGKPLGRKHYALLCHALSDLPPGQVVGLDFADVETVTGSWINAALVPLLAWAADPRNDLFLILVNFKAQWLDELQLVTELTRSCFLVAEGQALHKSATLIGALDAAQRTTLEAVVSGSVSTGAGLERVRPEDGVKATAWNNRLKDLHDKRLLRREKKGREQFYSPVVEEILING